MKIREYEYRGSGWVFNRLAFQEMNLIVGDSGTGKTRILNTIFNLGSSVAQGRVFGDSQWDISLEIDKDIYKWQISTTKKDTGGEVESEKLTRNGDTLLIRDEKEFRFKDELLPKLQKDQLSVFILRDEELIRPIYEGFSKILRRRFFSDEQEGNNRIIPLNRKMVDAVGGKHDLFELYKLDLPLNPRLFVLQKHFPLIFKKIVDTFLESFDYISEAFVNENLETNQIMIPENTPVFCIKERNVEKILRLDELSSGMQKALLIITDMFSLPSGSIYMIDEYENSLGIGPINLLPNLLLTETLDIQLLITSHHPYIITKIPVSHWYVAHRIGSSVTFEYGEKLEKRYSESLQDKYFQLINDKFYIEGVE